VSTFARDERCRVVPRWRFLSDRGQAAELCGDPRLSRKPDYDPAYLTQRILDWTEARSYATAADLVSGALATGVPTKATDAARFLLEGHDHVAPGAVKLARQCLGGLSDLSAAPSLQRSLLLAPDLTSRSRATIRTARQRISRNPRNVEAWLDMSRAYAILGQKELAERAMEHALMVAPDHRVALRAAARLYVHLHDFERAARLLSQHPRTRGDPWLLASDIAISSIIGRTSKHMRSASSLVQSEQLPPSHLSELHSALATVELDRGDFRHARRHARQSLIAPNDNCAAQARWLAVRLPQIVVTEEAFELAQSYEARCWRAMREGNWSGALGESHAWLLDEPYSGRPAVIGSFIGITLTEDYAFGAACARVGIQADPTNRTLHNNLAVALAYEGDQAEAEVQYGLVRRHFDDEYPEYVFEATGGLLRFRAGDAAAGRSKYARAIELAPHPMRSRVLAYWLREELNVSPSAAAEALALCDKAQIFAKGDSFTIRLIELVRARANTLRDVMQQVSALPKATLLTEPNRMASLIKADDAQ